MSSASGSGGGKGDQGGGKVNKVKLETLSAACRDEIVRMTKLPNLMYIVAYSAQKVDKPVVVMAPGYHEEEHPPCNSEDPEYEVKNGKCNDPRPFNPNCKYVTIGTMTYWICA